MCALWVRLNRCLLTVHVRLMSVIERRALNGNKWGRRGMNEVDLGLRIPTWSLKDIVLIDLISDLAEKNENMQQSRKS